jgi:hypothetical protein
MKSCRLADFNQDWQVLDVASPVVWQTFSASFPFSELKAIVIKI